MATLSQKDVKLLWGRSGNRCSDCRTLLSHDTTTGHALPLGEQAHIVAEQEDGPRGESNLTPTERNSYANMILLCPTCHTRVDKAVDDYPVERLHLMKVNHELWVASALAGDAGALDPSQLLYSDLVDHIVEATGLSNWASWTSFALSPDPSWPDDTDERLFALRSRLQAALWPGKFPELESSMQCIADTLHAAFEHFSEHCTREGNVLRNVRFYKLQWNQQGVHERLVEQYKAWERACDEFLREATRAANWFADCVRRDINPQFFLLGGRFVLVEGPYSNLEYYSKVYMYPKDVLSTLPGALTERIQQIKQPYLDIIEA